MQNDVSLEKRRLRRETREQIRRLSDQYIEASDRGICAAVAALPAFREAKRVFAYYSVEREVDTRGILALARQLGKGVALPRIRERSMDFAAEDGLPDLHFGIPQPGAGAERLRPEAGDIVLVPALCYDAAGYRLGQGGGYYDGLLPGLAALTVGLGREALLHTRLPREPHDLPVRILVTEKKTLRLP